jgi:dTDP-glucose pyrophosphorylase
MNTGQRTFLTPRKVLAVILGGGAGTRLFPLTKERAKSAAPLGGKYRLVDKSVRIDDDWIITSDGKPENVDH